ncbi:hypothetical protein [Yimella sp. cx-51]|uniref:hypothetical protein n=1 Tax=Yimella sp. cx-51 TaxID=2770551 RepID=UPI00165E73C4|nr:hypothetical protein [Yimella sp. cx-51]MBC9958015.1 hypothetical protein [Yimella sp. cx-51]QTH38138.1 hypothetical protein J5M86_00030 [Yimella sp. cx-51]
MTDPLHHVLVADQRLEHARIALDEAVAEARREGASWQAIGDVLGMSRQAVFKRFGKPSEVDGDQPPPARPLTSLRTLTEDVFRHLADGHAARLHERMTRHAAAVLQVADLEATWAAAERSTGVLRGFEGTEIRTPDHTPLTTDEATGQVIGVTALVCESGTWHGRVAWDPWDRIAGLLIVPADVPGLPF